MAIEEFGESLLKDVRTYKKSQLDEQRAYERSQERRAERKGLAFLAAGKAVDVAVPAITSFFETDLARKTNDFLKQSEFYNNKIKLNDAEKQINMYLQDEITTQDRNISYYDLYLEQYAEQAVAENQKINPEEIKAGEEEGGIASYMLNPQIQKLAQEKADYAKFVIERADKFATGRAGLSIDELANRAKPRKLSQNFIRGLTGQNIGVDEFNKQMSELSQLQAATEIMQKFDKNSENRIKAATQLRANGETDESYLRLVAGVRERSKAEIEAMERFRKNGERFEDQVEFLTTADGSLVAKTYRVITQKDNSKRIDQKFTTTGPYKYDVLIDGNGITTAADIENLQQTMANIFDFVKDNTIADSKGKSGYNDWLEYFRTEIQPEGVELTQEIVLKAITSMTRFRDWTISERIGAKADTQVQAALADVFAEKTKTLQNEIMLLEKIEDKSSMTNVPTGRTDPKTDQPIMEQVTVQERLNFLNQQIRTEFNSFIRDLNQPVTSVPSLQVFTEDLLKVNPNATEEEAKEQYEILYPG